MYDPAANTNFFPKCPVRQITGYQCPGCGSQRAAHALLNFDIRAAFAYNPLLVLSIPYLLLGAVLDRIELSERLLRLRKALFGPLAIKIILAIVITFWIVRNLI